VTYPEFIRKGRLLGDKVGIFEVLDYFSTLEIKDPEESKLASRIFPEWWENEERKTALFTGKA
jgi:hypothetical protein